VVDGAGFTFQRGSSSDMAERLRFLIANPSVREAAGKAAKRRIKDLYQWQKVAEDIESAYFKVLGWHPVAPGKKPNTRAVVAEESASAQRRAG
jgi:glycosyltransferase involved in cell wall biosynthesis